MLEKDHCKEGGEIPRESGLLVPWTQLLLGARKKGNGMTKGKEMLVEEVQESKDEQDNTPLCKRRKVSFVKEKGSSKGFRRFA